MSIGSVSEFPGSPTHLPLQICMLREGTIRSTQVIQCAYDLGQHVQICRTRQEEHFYREGPAPLSRNNLWKWPTESAAHRQLMQFHVIGMGIANYTIQSDGSIWLILNSGGTYDTSGRKGSKKIYSLGRPNLCLRLSRHVGTAHKVKEGSARSLDMVSRPRISSLLIIVCVVFLRVPATAIGKSWHCRRR